jgi:hypothetical protein
VDRTLQTDLSHYSCSRCRLAQHRVRVDTGFPLTITSNVCGLIVEKGKASYACREPSRVAWPRDLSQRQNGCRCWFTNTARVPMISVSMWIPIHYQSKQATLRLREESIPVSQSLEPDTPVDLYVFDDSGWDPVVTMPREGFVRPQGEIQSEFIKVDYRDGRPVL